MKSLTISMILTLSIIVVVLALGGHSLATVPGPNGRIVWGSFNPDIGDADIYTANPDGAHETRVAGPSECHVGRRTEVESFFPGSPLSAGTVRTRSNSVLRRHRTLAAQFGHQMVRESLLNPGTTLTPALLPAYLACDRLMGVTSDDLLRVRLVPTTFRATIRRTGPGSCSYADSYSVLVISSRLSSYQMPTARS